MTRNEAEHDNEEQTNEKLYAVRFRRQAVGDWGSQTLMSYTLERLYSSYEQAKDVAQDEIERHLEPDEVVEENLDDDFIIEELRNDEWDTIVQILAFDVSSTDN
jgi:hypothetical protein